MEAVKPEMKFVDKQAIITEACTAASKILIEAIGKIGGSSQTQVNSTTDFGDGIVFELSFRPKKLSVYQRLTNKKNKK